MELKMTKSDIDECAAKGGCVQVQDLKEVVYNEISGVIALSNRKVSWTAMVGICAIAFLSVITVIIYFSDIRAQAREYPGTKNDVQVLKEDIAVIKERIESFEKWKTEDKELKKE